MKIVVGELYSALNSSDFFGFAANGVITAAGLVMGAGSARQVRDLNARLPRLYGDTIEPASYWHTANIHRYGLAFVSVPCAGELLHTFAFQTKAHWRDTSSLDLIGVSARLLRASALGCESREFHMPFPGIGNGGLAPEDVLPIISHLPDNVSVWVKRPIRGITHP